MRLAQHQQSFVAWQNTAMAACRPLLDKARAELVTAQSRPDADEEIGRVEELLNADLEPLFIRQQRALEQVQRAAERAMEAIEEPTEAESAVMEQIGGGADRLRDLVARKITSLTAQARAAELLPTGPHGASGQPRHCTNCGAPVSAQAAQARRCASCGVAIG